MTVPGDGLGDAVPKRIQLRRTKGWRLPLGARSVARPSKYGNPYRVEDYVADYPDASEAERHRMAKSDFRGLVEGRWDGFDDTPPYPSVDEIRADLAGCDLACFCRPEFDCHVDVLLEVANA